MSLDIYLETNDCLTIHHENITHNLAEMAGHAGLYLPMWRPETLGISRAWQLRMFLVPSLAQLKMNPAYFQTFNPKNGWGDYETLLETVENLLFACERNPQARVRVTR